MRKILQRVGRELHGFDDEDEDGATPLMLIVGVFVFVVSPFVVILGTVFAFYFSF
jgi:hypothetical protein